MIANASPLIIFGKLNKVDLLEKLFKQIEISNQVYQEVIVKGLEKKTKDSFVIKDFLDKGTVKVFNLENKYLELANKISLIHNIDLGEAETIVLAIQLNKNSLLIDEKFARNAAKSFNLRPLGYLRVLLLAYKNNLITKDKLNELLEAMIQSNLRLSSIVLLKFWSLFSKLKKDS